MPAGDLPDPAREIIQRHVPGQMELMRFELSDHLIGLHPVRPKMRQRQNPVPDNVAPGRPVPMAAGQAVMHRHLHGIP